MRLLLVKFSVLLFFIDNSYYYFFEEIVLELLYEYAFFLAKGVTSIILILLCVAGLFALGDANKKSRKSGDVLVRDLGEEYQDKKEMLEEFLESGVSKPRNRCRAVMVSWSSKKKEKGFEETDDLCDDSVESDVSNDESRGTTFVLDFNGGVEAQEVDSLREEITSILSVAKEGDEVFIRLESGGGFVSPYGLGAAQLQRIKDAGIKLTVSVDVIAASGGYMMACVADRIIAAPLATIGSVGVVAQLPNFNKLMKKHGVDYEQHTAGDHKRTLTMFGENTDEDRAKFRSELEETHELFIEHVEAHRPDLLDFEFATGECWYGSKAKECGLVDEVLTSDEYLVSIIDDRIVLHLAYEVKKTLAQRLADRSAKVVESTVLKAIDKGMRPKI